jgi:hypothetical protein
MAKLSFDDLVIHDTIAMATGRTTALIAMMARHLAAQVEADDFPRVRRDGAGALRLLADMLDHMTATVEAEKRGDA